MKGHIFNLLETFIEETAGLDVLEQVLDSCSFDTSVGFIRTENYPDEMLEELVLHATEALNISIEQAHFAFGEWIFPQLAKLVPEQYTQFSHPVPMLAKLDYIHKVELKKLYPDATPPFFDYYQIDEFHGQIKYQSKRKMFDLVKGVLQGVAKYYGVEIETDLQKNYKCDESCGMFHLTFSQAYLQKLSA